MAALPAPHTWTAGDDATSTNLQTLTAAINFLKDPPRCHAYQNSAQTLGSGAFASILLDTEEVDTDAIHSTSVNTSRMTIVTAGRYLVIGQVDFASHATGYRAVRLIKNGSATATASNYTTVASAPMGLQVVDEILCAAGDYLELQGYQNSGVNNVLITGAGATFLHCKWVSNS